MPAGQGLQPPIIGVMPLMATKRTATATFRTGRWLKGVFLCGQRLLESMVRIHGGFTTCMEMYGSGVMIGVNTIMIRKPLIPAAQQRGRFGRFAAVPGVTERGTAVLPVVIGVVPAAT